MCAGCTVAHPRHAPHFPFPALASSTWQSAVMLASSLYNVSGYSMVIGLSSALETLCGQVCVAQAARAANSTLHGTQNAAMQRQPSQIDRPG